MFTRPFAPFRVRPVRETEIRRSPLQTADLAELLDGLEPVSVKAQRRPVKAQAILVTQPRVRMATGSR